MLKAISTAEIQDIIQISADIEADRASRATGSVISGRDISVDDIRREQNRRKPLEDAVRALSDEARFELMAVMWLGRGDEIEDFERAVQHARADTDAGDVGYITTKTPLATYLRNGLKKLAQAGH